MKLPFWKLSGAGNDFVLVEAQGLGSRSRAALARRLCPRRSGIGSDGLLVVGSGPEPRLEFLNPDGSRAFCGNGTRCAAWWLHERGAGLEFSLRTCAGPIRCVVVGKNRARTSMPPPRLLGRTDRLEAAGRTLELCAMECGSPHALAFVSNLEGFPVEAAGREIRGHPAYLPEGTNVDFVETRRHAVFLRTYERGVEGETLACGSGAAAAGYYAWSVMRWKPPIRIRTGGGWLRVLFDEGSGDCHLEGPAAVVFHGEVAI
jgi:diaminopimelate epimerase